MKLLFISLFLLTACGESPLFNHSVEASKNFVRGLPVRTEGHEFKKLGMSFSLDWTEGPSTSESSFVMKTWKTDVSTVNGPYSDLPGILKVVLWMPHMGHGSSPVKITKLANGEYKITNVFFIMQGQWEVRFSVTKNNTVADELTLPYDI